MMSVGFGWIRDLFEMPAATAKRLLDGQRALPEDLSSLTDEVLQNTVLRLGWLDAMGRPAGCSKAIEQALREEATERKLPGVHTEADPYAFDVISTLYDVAYELMSSAHSAEQLDTVAEAEAQLRALSADLPPAQAGHGAHLSVEFAERRAAILVALGLDDDADAAFRDALVWAVHADSVLPAGRYRRRSLARYADWLAQSDADQTLRTLLPVIASDAGEAAPDADSLALRCLLATFFQRHGDKLEAEVHIEAMIADLDRLGLRESASGDYRDVVPVWAARIRESCTSHVERNRLLNQVFVCYVAVNAHRFQGRDGAPDDRARMFAVSDRLAELREVERTVAAEDASFLATDEAAGPMRDYAPIPGPIDDVQRFARAMEPAEGDAPPFEAVAALAAFTTNESVAEPYRARAHVRLAHLALNAGRLDEARDRYEAAGRLGRENALEDVTIEALKGVGLVHFAGGDFALASKAAGAGVARVEEMRRKVSAPYLSSAFMADKFELYVLAINSARRAGEIGTMLARMEMMKARALQVPPGAVPAEVRKRAGARLKALRDDAMAADKDTVARQRLLDRRQAVWQEMALQHVPDPAPFDLARFQRVLDERTIALNYFFFDDSVLVVSAISRDQVLTERIAIPADAPLFPAIETFARASNRSIGIEHAIAPLGAILLPRSFDPLLEAAGQIIFCPHQALHAVPFTALPWRGAPLIDRFEIGCVPSLTCLLYPTPGSAGSGFFAIAAEVCWPAGMHRPLVHAEREAEAAAAAWSRGGGPASIMTGADASRERLQHPETADALARARVVHIGTHGSDVASAEAARAPMECALYLSDGPLDGLELSAMDMSAEVVVLAACHAAKRATSARGLARLPADAVYGLQAAFHAAGAQSILGGLWIVDDKCTPKITEAFHIAMAQGMTAAAALRAAILNYRAKAGPILSEAAFWAPFTLIAFTRAAFAARSLEETNP